MSRFWPVTVHRAQGRYHPLEVTWENGTLVLNSAHANQSHGSLHRVWQQAFKEAFTDRPLPTDVLILGFGAGSIARILRSEMGLHCPITGVDNDPEVLRIAAEHFGTRTLADVLVLKEDAFAFAAKHPERYALVCVDLFRELDLAPGVDSAAFARQLHRLTTPTGLLLVNTVGHNPESSARSARVGRELRLCFGRVTEHVYEGQNVVFKAW